VLPASNRLPAGISSNNTIGLRIPNCPVAREILQQTGALATSSANLAGAAPLPTMAAVDRTFPTVLALASDLIANEQPSTVVCWQDHGWQVLRQGAIQFSSAI
jgi:L-threonylcarbamoyladenylate synthase